MSQSLLQARENFEWMWRSANETCGPNHTGAERTVVHLPGPVLGMHDMGRGLAWHNLRTGSELCFTWPMMRRVVAGAALVFGCLLVGAGSGLG